MAVLDATLRLRPGVLGDDQSIEEESFTAGLLDYPTTPGPNWSMGGPCRRY